MSGSECEYRHSETARLNPRDCWYWVGGNCHPACPFRHPPLDGRPEGSPDAVHASPYLSANTSKTSVPCYFYFNTHCIKGDKCPFLHGSHVPKSTKASSAGPEAHPLENKPSSGSDTGPGSIEAPSNISERKTTNIQFQSKHVLQLEAPNNIIEEHSASVPISVPDCEETTGKLLNNLPPDSGFVNENGSPLCLDHSSGDPGDDCVEPEERWESSPGFDVLVDDGSEQLGYEEEPDYLLAHDQETSRRLGGHLLQYEYEDQVDYDCMDYPELLYEHSVYDSYDHLGTDKPSDHIRRVPDQRERMLPPMMSQRRKFLPRELEVEVRKGDLRDHLQKRKRDSRDMPRSCKRRSSHVSDGKREHPMRQSTAHRHPGRLASEVGINMIGSCSDSDFRLNARDISGRVRYSESKHSKPKLHGRERKRRHAKQLPVVSSEISRRITSDSNLTSFTGPKTLSQIKEEKRRAGVNESNSRSTQNPGETRVTDVPEDFEAPKPPSELIKDKGKMSSEKENTPRSIASSQREKWQFDEDKVDMGSGSEYDEEDEGLEKKLVAILA
ncbi:hypothetical protein ACLOJK_031969 [Asimina triloba]